MALSSTSSTQASHAPAPAEQIMSNSDAGLLLMGALAGAAMTKEARKQYRAITRKMAWKALGYKFKGLFNKKYRGDSEIAGMPTWLFIVLVIAAAAIGIALFGLLGFLIVLALAVIIYLLVNEH